jgi:hypothetical protein
MITPRRKETVSNFRLNVTSGMSGWFAVLLVDVTDERGTYTDIQQTGVGRYRTRQEAVKEATSWSLSDEIPLDAGIS